MLYFSGFRPFKKDFEDHWLKEHYVNNTVEYTEDTPMTSWLVDMSLL